MSKKSQKTAIFYLQIREDCTPKNAGANKEPATLTGIRVPSWVQTPQIHGESAIHFGGLFTFAAYLTACAA